MRTTRTSIRSYDDKDGGGGYDAAIENHGDGADGAADGDGDDPDMAEDAVDEHASMLCMIRVTMTWP